MVEGLGGGRAGYTALPARKKIQMNSGVQPSEVISLSVCVCMCVQVHMCEESYVYPCGFCVEVRRQHLLLKQGASQICSSPKEKGWLPGTCLSL